MLGSAKASSPVIDDESTTILNENDSQIRAAEEIIAHPPIKKKAIETLLMGLRAAIENYHDKGTVNEILRLLPSFDTLSDEHKTTYLASFIRAIELSYHPVVQNYLSQDNLITLKGEHIVDGLQAALTAAGSKHPSIDALGMALENCDSDELTSKDTAEKMYHVLKKLAIIGQDVLARKLLEKHRNIALMYLAPLAEFCMQQRHTNMLAYLFLLDPQFEVISLEKMVAGLMRWLPEDESIRDAAFADPFKLLEYILINAEESLTSQERDVILMRLQKANAVEKFAWLFERNNEDLSIEYLNNRLTYALAKNQTELVPVLIKRCQRQPEVWDRYIWSPSLEMFKQVIFNQRKHLLPLLLNCDPNAKFVGVVNQALAYAASIGEIEMVHTILEKLKELKCKIATRAAVEIAVRNEKREVVIYLFNNLPGLTIENKMASVAYAPEHFKATMIEIVNSQALVEQRLKEVVSELPTQGLTDDNVNRQLIYVLLKFETVRITEADPIEREITSPPLLAAKNRAANNRGNDDDKMQEVPLANGAPKRAHSSGSFFKSRIV